MPKRRRFPILLIALAFAACADEPPPTATSAEQELPVFADAEEAATPTGQHLIKLGKKGPSNLAAAVAEAGGTLIRTHPQIGYALVDGLTDEAASAFGDATRDMMVAWQDGTEAMGVEQASGPSEAGHDPTTAFFYPFQWDMMQINAAGAWAAGASGEGVRVAIIDSGIDPFHADLAGLVDAA
ncbi:MAG: hypothetical protein HKN73_01785, partial [Gemmatimonadetes bacterium]|nr:hypothetical protein [Gemmatimonadota bacterium]